MYVYVIIIFGGGGVYNSLAYNLYSIGTLEKFNII